MSSFERVLTSGLPSPRSPHPHGAGSESGTREPGSLSFLAAQSWPGPVACLPAVKRTRRARALGARGVSGQPGGAPGRPCLNVSSEPSEPAVPASARVGQRDWVRPERGRPSPAGVHRGAAALATQAAAGPPEPGLWTTPGRRGSGSGSLLRVLASGRRGQRRAGRCGHGPGPGEDSGRLFP